MTLSNKPEILLSDKSPLSKGMERMCYVHPNDPNLVVKVPLHTGVNECQANEDELKGYQLLKEDNFRLDFISHCYGFISTDLGKGLLCDCIRDENEEVSKTIWDVVIYQEECDIEYVLNPRRPCLVHAARGLYARFFSCVSGLHMTASWQLQTEHNHPPAKNKKFCQSVQCPQKVPTPST